MNHLTREYVTKLKDSLLFINAVVIIYNASLFLLSTKYISVHYYARDFLNKVSYITRTPQNIFFESIFLFIILVLLMKLREKDNLKMANGLVYIEIILSFLLIIRLNGSYNGILLFVFADLLYNMRNIKHMALLLLMAFGLLLISDFNILSNIIHMPSIESYLSFYPNSSRTFMLFAKNILASLNVVVFILYLICQVLVQQEETKKISKELQLASKVNDELKTYSALSEKMAEDKEMACEGCRHTERTERERSNLMKRLRTIEGQIRGIEKMVENDAYCPDIVMQVSAVSNALNSFNKLLLAAHIHGCVTEDIKEGKDDKVDELCTMLQKLMK